MMRTRLTFIGRVRDTLAGDAHDFRLALDRIALDDYEPRRSHRTWRKLEGQRVRVTITVLPDRPRPTEPPGLPSGVPRRPKPAPPSLSAEAVPEPAP